MSEQLDQKLVESITDLTTNLTQAKSFVLTEMPEVIQQFIMFNTFKSVGYTVLGLTLVIMCILFIRAQFKIRRELENQYFDGEPFIVAICFLILGFLFFIFNFMDTVQLLMAPKVWLLENIKHLIPKC